MKAIKLLPSFQNYIWGGVRLREEYGKKCDFDRVAESWELSCHPDGPCYIADGEYKGMTLRDYIAREGKQVLGTDCDVFEDFPILTKLIDARDNLSVQVHPNDEYARKYENSYGKTEMWYVLDCEPGAELLYGFKNPITRDEFRRSIEENTLLDVVNHVPVKKGDVFFIPSGMLHAIGAGIMVAEIQQNSNLTYRVYDYGRVGADGKPRQLHIEQALNVTTLTPPDAPGKAAGETVRKDGFSEKLLASCKYFTVKELNVESACACRADSTSFHSLLALSDGLSIESEGEVLSISKGDSVFIPADSGDYVIKGKGEILLTTV